MCHTADAMRAHTVLGSEGIAVNELAWITRILVGSRHRFKERAALPTD